MPRIQGCRRVIWRVQAPLHPVALTWTKRRSQSVRGVKSQVFKASPPVPRKNASDRIHPHPTRSTRANNNNSCPASRDNGECKSCQPSQAAVTTPSHPPSPPLCLDSPCPSAHSLCAVHHPLFGPAQVERARGSQRAPELCRPRQTRILPFIHLSNSPFPAPSNTHAVAMFLRIRRTHWPWVVAVLFVLSTFTFYYAQTVS